VTARTIPPGTTGLDSRFANAVPLASFIETAKVNKDLWESVARRATVPAEIVARAARLRAHRRLLVLLEDWCGDAVHTIPPLAALAAAVPQLELRVLARDVNLDVMDAHLTNGSRSIPIVIVLDECGQELGWWGPRPAALQAWVMSPEARAMDPGVRYKEIRTWYARDRGRAALLELLDLMEGDAQAAAA
jgi:hypothetical protein